MPAALNWADLVVSRAGAAQDLVRPDGGADRQLLRDLRIDQVRHPSPVLAGSTLAIRGNAFVLEKTCVTPRVVLRGMIDGQVREAPLAAEVVSEFWDRYANIGMVVVIIVVTFVSIFVWALAKSTLGSDDSDGYELDIDHTKMDEIENMLNEGLKEYDFNPVTTTADARVVGFPMPGGAIGPNVHMMVKAGMLFLNLKTH